MLEGRKFFIKWVYVLFVIVLLEGALRLLFRSPAFSKLISGNEDVTWRNRWIDRHRDGVEIYYKFDIYDTTKGWVSKPGLRDLKVFNDKTLSTNSKGLRGKKEFSYGKHPSKTRVLILGDSFTFGDGVGGNETYSFHLQKMMPAAEVINMGIHGYGHDQMLIFFQEEGIKYKPEIVMLGLLATDISRNLLQFRDFAKPRFVLEKDSLKVSGSPVPQPEEIIEGDWKRFRILDIFSKLKYFI